MYSIILSNIVFIWGDLFDVGFPRGRYSVSRRDHPAEFNVTDSTKI
ncbi:MAG: hypothetical protein QXQ29_03450 [Candidatus Bathyarchaeia archaeon]